jgi:WD40 repeat protein
MIEIKRRYPSKQFSSVDESDFIKLDMLEGHTSKISAGIITSDNKFAITSGGRGIFCYKDNNIRIWDIELQRQVHVLQGHEKRITRIALSKCGNYLISGGLDDFFLVWSMEDFRVEKKIPEQLNSFTMISDCLLANFFKQNIRIWDIKKGIMVHQFPISGCYRTPIIGIFENESNQFWVLLNSRRCELYNLTSFALESEISFPDTVDTNMLIWNNNQFCIFGNTNNVILFQISTLNLQIIYSHKFNVRFLDIANSELLVTGSLFGSKIYNLTSKSLLHSFDYIGNLLSINLNATLFLTSQGKSVAIFNATENKHYDLFKTHRGTIISACKSSNNLFFTLSMDKTLRIWDEITLQERFSMLYNEVHEKSSLSLAYNEKYLILSSPTSIRTFSVANLFLAVNQASTISQLPNNERLCENYIPTDIPNDTYETLMGCKLK